MCPKLNTAVALEMHFFCRVLSQLAVVDRLGPLSTSIFGVTPNPARNELAATTGLSTASDYGKTISELGDFRMALRTDEWTATFDELGGLCEKIWDRSQEITGPGGDPAIVSTQLFKRTYGHMRAFAVLWRSELNLDADIILRSALEVAICHANLEQRRDEFVIDLKSDAASTVRAQVPFWFSHDPGKASETITEAESLFGSRTSAGKKHSRLSAQALADAAGVGALYTFYKDLSATRAHVTGVSMIGDAVPVGDSAAEEQVRSLRRLRRYNSLRMMCAALQISCNRHSRLVGYLDFLDCSIDAGERMNLLASTEGWRSWPSRQGA